MKDLGDLLQPRNVRNTGFEIESGADGNGITVVVEGCAIFAGNGDDVPSAIYPFSASDLRRAFNVRSKLESITVFVQVLYIDSWGDIISGISGQAVIGEGGQVFGRDELWPCCQPQQSFLFVRWECMI